MDGDSTQKPNTPIPCANQCGFFGNPLTDNLCSKCHRDLRPKKDDNNNNNNNSNNNNNNIVKKEVETNKQQPTAVAETNKVELAESASATTSCDGDEEHVEEKKVQTDTSKCFSCSKKIGLLGFKCRCSFYYCSTHRYSNKHDCSFDYKALNKEKLTKDNPIVAAEKITKL